ncbi:MAG: peptide/nickel transport system ATP-binding protein, partial [Pseudonocardiales bacterium]|nr:peptide/nickel transport system ATP-binding protein [Pseudonocardiales bacterium]
LYCPIKRGVSVDRTVGHVPAGDDVSRSLNEGATLGLVGESGCGKTTLSRSIVRLLEPTGGTIRFRGQDITKSGRRELAPVRRQLQMVFQDPQASLNPRKRVGQIVAAPLKLHREDGHDIESRVRDLLARVGLNPEHINRFPHEFSGGQRQRIGIARALALRPRLVVCDEPVSALDVSIQAQVINLLGELQEQLDLTYVFISHDLSVVRHVSDRIAVMYLGKIVEIADVDGLHDHTRHPYTQALLSAVPSADPDTAASRRRIVLAGDLPSPAAPPTGCRFHPRCPKAQQKCVTEDPELVPRLGDGPEHRVACHFPLADGELMTSSRPSIGDAAADMSFDPVAAEKAAGDGAGGGA